MITVAKVLLALVPLARRVADAMDADSQGGKAITEEEWLDIVLGSTPRTLRRLGKVAQGKALNRSEEEETA